MLFPFLTVFIIFILFLAFRYRQTDRQIKDMQDSFWKREAMANSTAPVDLDGLRYITIPLEKFPLGFLNDSQILSIEHSLQDLSQKRILNLTGKTNTELKELYGVSNLDAVVEYGDNFDQLTVLLRDYAKALVDAKMIAEAIAVLEFGVGIGTDISQNYTLLGDCYKALGKMDKISYLKEQVSSANLMLTSSILRYLDTLLTDDSSPSFDGPEDFELNK